VRGERWIRTHDRLDHNRTLGVTSRETADVRCPEVLTRSLRFAQLRAIWRATVRAHRGALAVRCEPPLQLGHADELPAPVSGGRLA